MFRVFDVISKFIVVWIIFVKNVIRRVFIIVKIGKFISRIYCIVCIVDINWGIDFFVVGFKCIVIWYFRIIRDIIVCFFLFVKVIIFLCDK